MLSLLVNAEIGWSGTDALYLMAAGVSSAATASVLLGTTMIGVVWLCRVLRLNPDNIATPVASALGDLVTLFLASVIGGRLYDHDSTVK